jgi:hypothetical protein
MPYRRGMSPLTTWHSQNGLLLVSLTWGGSYLIPAADRIPFSEVFPSPMSHSIFPEMWLWGLLLFVPALIALVADLVLKRGNGDSKRAWFVALGGHYVLSGIYASLTVGAAFEGFSEIHYAWSWHTAAAMVSAISRPILWGLIAYLHTTYARLPKPVSEELSDV